MKSKKLPRPTLAEYEKPEQYKKMSQAEGWNRMEEMMDFQSSYDWSVELVVEGARCGLKTPLGETILPLKFEDFKMLTSAEINKGDRVVAKFNGKWGVVVADGEGTWVVKPEFEYIGYPNDLTHVQKDGKWGVIDIPSGEYLVRPECDEIEEWNGFMFMNGIGIYKKDGKYGVVTYGGKFTEPLFEEYRGDFDGGWVEVNYQGQWGYINEKNEFTADEEEAYYSYYDN